MEVLGRKKRALKKDTVVHRPIFTGTEHTFCAQPCLWLNMFTGLAFALLAAASSAAVQPRVRIGELFQDIFLHATGHCVLGSTPARLNAAPWLSPRDASSPLLPSMRILNRTLLSVESVHNPLARPQCGVDLEALLGESILPDERLCAYDYNGPLRAKQEGRFAEASFNLEVILLTRWLQGAAEICDDECDADVIVLPSLSFHMLVAGGDPISHECIGSLAAEFWQRTAARYYAPGTTGPLVVLQQAQAPWEDLATRNALIEALHYMPAEFNSRVIIGASEKVDPDKHLVNITRFHRMLRARRANLHGQPLHVTLPLPVGVAHKHVTRAMSHLASFPPKRRSIAVLLHGSSAADGLMVAASARGLAAIPISKGAAHRADCNTAVACVLAHCQSAADSDCVVANSEHRAGVLGLAMHSAFCLLFPDDPHMRAHMFLAAQSGCVPVLIGHGNHAEWPWTSPSSSSSLGAKQQGTNPSSPSSSTRILSLNSFTVQLDVSRVLGSPSSWLDELIGYARDETRMARMHAELHRAATAWNFNQRNCGTRGCDAFALFRETIERAWRAMSSARGHLWLQELLSEEPVAGACAPSVDAVRALLSRNPIPLSRRQSVAIGGRSRARSSAPASGRSLAFYLDEGPDMDMRSIHSCFDEIILGGVPEDKYGKDFDSRGAAWMVSL